MNPFPATSNAETANHVAEGVDRASRHRGAQDRSDRVLRRRGSPRMRLRVEAGDTFSFRVSGQVGHAITPHGQSPLPGDARHS
jgi:hypothetical protein